MLSQESNEKKIYNVLGDGRKKSVQEQTKNQQIQIVEQKTNTKKKKETSTPTS